MWIDPAGSRPNCGRLEPGGPGDASGLDRGVGPEGQQDHRHDGGELPAALPRLPVLPTGISCQALKPILALTHWHIPFDQ